jgi:tripartite-type tricarboxylate transporter receptor subunit TctC
MFSGDSMKLRMLALLAAVCLALSAGFASAQTFPVKPVRLVVPYPPGGSVDNIARAVTLRLGKMWPQPIIIENKPGGGTQIGAELVARSEPDGHTLFATGMETFAISPFMYSKLSYDVKEFTPVSGFGMSNQLLVVPASSPLKTLADLIREAKAKPGHLRYGTIGLGGSSHINMVLFEKMAGVTLTPVHYRGGAPLVTDLLGGHVPMSFLSAQLVDQGIKAGKLRAIAIGSKKRLPQYPDVPTVEESGVPGFEAVSWFGVWAPARTPPDVVAKVNADLQKVFADREFQEKFLIPSWLSPIPGSPAEFAAFIRAEADKWSKLIKEANLKVN